MSSITEGEIKIKLPEEEKKTKRSRYFKVFFIIAVVLLVASASFGLGRLSAIEERKTQVSIERIPENYEFLATDYYQGDGESEELEGESGSSGVSEGEVAGASDGEVVGSKNSDVYHFPWCPGAQRISEENLVSFDSIAEARSAGYRPAANCKGLE